MWRVCTFLADSNVSDMLDKTSDSDQNSNYEILSKAHVISIYICSHYNVKTFRFKKYKTKQSHWILNGIIKSIKDSDKLYKTGKVKL